MQVSNTPWNVADGNAVLLHVSREGEYEFRLKARNDAGESAFPKSRRFCIDRQAPLRDDAIVSVQGGGACATGLPVTITWAGFRDQTFCESWPGIIGYHIRYFLDAQELPDLSPYLPSFTKNSYLEFEQLPEGELTLLIQAIDRVGLFSTPLWFPLEVDRTPPKLLMAGFAETQLNATEGGVLRMLALGDDTANAAWIDVLFAGGSAEPMPLGLSLSDRGLQGDTFSRDGLYIGLQGFPPGLVPGSYLLAFEYTDSCGNAAGMWPFLTVGE
jgi:hypothetical protein